MRRALKIAAINLAVGAALVTLANVASAVVLWARGDGITVDPSSDFFDRPSHESREKAVRIYTDFHALDTEYRAFVAWRRMPYRGETTTVDERGIRVHPRDPEDSQSARLYALFGGSTMWGSGSDDSGTIPAHLDYASPDLRAMNLGESGWTSRQNLDMLINLIDEDVPLAGAIFYDGVNDVAVGCREGHSVITHGQEPVIRNAMRKEKAAAAFVKVFDPTLTLIAKTIAKLKVSSMAEIPYACAKDPERAERVAEVMIDNWEHARAIAEARGIDFFAVLQPVSYVGAARVDYLDQENTLAAEYAVVYPIVQRKLAERGHGWALDLTRIFDGDEPLYVDYCHVSTRGNAMVAERLLEAIERELTPPGAGGTSADGPKRD